MRKEQLRIGMTVTVDKSYLSSNIKSGLHIAKPEDIEEDEIFVVNRVSNNKNKYLVEVFRTLDDTKKLKRVTEPILLPLEALVSKPIVTNKETPIWVVLSPSMFTYLEMILIDDIKTDLESMVGSYAEIMIKQNDKFLKTLSFSIIYSSMNKSILEYIPKTAKPNTSVKRHALSTWGNKSEIPQEIIEEEPDASLKIPKEQEDEVKLEETSESFNLEVAVKELPTFVDPTLESDLKAFQSTVGNLPQVPELFNIDTQILSNLIIDEQENSDDLDLKLELNSDGNIIDDNPTSNNFYTEDGTNKLAGIRIIKANKSHLNQNKSSKINIDEYKTKIVAELSKAITSISLANSATDINNSIRNLVKGVENK